MSSVRPSDDASPVDKLFGALAQGEHLQVARNADGVRRAWAVCLVISVENGLITRIDEYIDRAGSLTGDLETTPGLV